MLKRFSSLILALVTGSSVLAVTARPGNEHLCKMGGMGMMVGMQMPRASPTSRPSHEMMSGMHMPPASTTLSPSYEMMPGMHMPPASSTLSPSDELMPSRETMDHGMQMDHGVETMPGMETMPCCKKHATQSVSEQCCVNIPHETGSTGTTFNLRWPSFSVAVIHPAVVQSPLAVPKPYECPYSTRVFLPNLQASYIRNLSILI